MKKNLIGCLPAFALKEKYVNVIIETPKGSRVKYAYEPDADLFALKKALPEGMVFPFNFGFIPSTEAEDGDPLDVLILNQEPLIPGCLIKAHLVGALKAEQSEERQKTRNDRLIGMAVSKATPTSLESIKLEGKIIKEIKYFFESYNKLTGKEFKVLGKAGPKNAREMVRKAEVTFRANNSQNRM